jgi:hypothetical protein
MDTSVMEVIEEFKWHNIPFIILKREGGRGIRYYVHAKQVYRFSGNSVVDNDGDAMIDVAKRNAITKLEAHGADATRGAILREILGK